MRRFVIVAAIAACTPSFATAAQAERHDVQVGRWRIGSGGKVCSMLMRLTDGRVLIIASPDGGNAGGLLVPAVAGEPVTAGQYAKLTFSGNGWSGPREGEAVPELKGYWVPFSAWSDMEKPTASFHLTVTGAAGTQVDDDVPDFPAARAEMNRCISRLPGKS